MLIDYDKHTDLESAATGSSSAASPGSYPPPPSFDSTDQPLFGGSAGQGYEDPPPEFTPYVAQSFVVGSGDVVSHDPHVNTDGEALFRFLLFQLSIPPNLQIRCQGTHTEFRSRSPSTSLILDDHTTTLSFSSSSGRHHHPQHGGHHHHMHRRNHQMDTVTDFDFTIDLSHLILTPPVFFSLPDSEAAYRGSLSRSLGTKNYRTILGWREARKWKKSKAECAGLGLAPWITSHDSSTHPAVAGKGVQTSNMEGSMSSLTLREWADEYCASTVHLKEFVFTKHVYNWNLTSLVSAIRAHIAKSYNSRLENGSIHISIETSADKVFIRPDNTLSRALSNKWIKFILIILFIYPFIWLYMRFGGAAKWDVCGAAYAMKKYLPLDGSENLSEDNEAGSSQASNFRVIQTSQGPMKVLGTREGEWFKEWERTISDLVNRRYISPIPLQGPDEERPKAGTVEADMLDGYCD